MQSFILDFFTTNILHCSKKVKNRHRKKEFFLGKKALMSLSWSFRNHIHNKFRVLLGLDKTASSSRAMPGSTTQNH